MDNDKSAFAEHLNTMGCNFPNGFCYRVFNVDAISGVAVVSAAFINALNDVGFNIELPDCGKPSNLADMFPRKVPSIYI
jgi:hypothetical protein